MNTRVSKNDTVAREIVKEVQQVRKFIMKHCISEFVFSDWAGACKHVQNAERWETVNEIGRLRKTGGEREQGGGSQTLGESVTVHDYYATTTGWARKGAGRLTHRRQV